MLPVKEASKSLYETSTVSHFACLLTPVLLAVTLSCLFGVFPTVFEDERDRSQSTWSCVQTSLQSVLGTMVNILPYKPPAQLIRAIQYSGII